MVANKWAEVHCMMCDKSFAVNWEHLEEDGSFMKGGKEAPILCPYCGAEALYAGESVVDEDLEDYGYEDYDDEERDEDGCLKREKYEEYAEADCGDYDDDPYYP